MWVRNRIHGESGTVERRAVGHVELRGVDGFRGTVMEYGTTGVNVTTGGPERFEPGSLRVVSPAADEPATRPGDGPRPGTRLHVHRGPCHFGRV